MSINRTIAAPGPDAAAGNTSLSNRSRVHNPPVELPQSNASNFFEEAKVEAKEEDEARRKFSRFCSKMSVEDPIDCLTLDAFCRLMQHYECTSAHNFEAYFHAIDRDKDDRLIFTEFFLGVCAADPSTTHILNSFTGHERSKFIFDFYDTDRNCVLDFEEFTRLNTDCLQTELDKHAARQEAIDKARELGIWNDGQFAGITRSQFYNFIQNEKMRGTSRLFRFQKTLLKDRTKGHSRRTGSTGGTGGGTAGVDGGAGGTGGGGGPAIAADTMIDECPSDHESLEWHAHLLDIEAEVDFDFDPSLASIRIPPSGRPAASPYASLLPPAPAPSWRLEQDNSAPAEVADIARKVLQTLATSHFEGLLAGNIAAAAEDDGVAAFTAASPAQLRAVCGAAVRLMEQEEMVIMNLQAPVKVFGALHGQLLDLLSHFKWQGVPTMGLEGDLMYTTYLFLGDYSDRGSYSLEVLLVLLCMKLINPQRVVLLRGQHENRHFNYHMGLRQECERRLGSVEGPRVYEHLNRVFEHMSLAAVIGGQLLAMGPGTLPVSFSRLEQLKKYKKPLPLPHPQHPRPAQNIERLNEQLLLEMFTPWPLLPRELGSGQDVSPNHVDKFCSQHGLAGVILGRRFPPRGYAFEVGGRLITLTSCLNYCDEVGGNDAAILCITKEEAPSSALQIRPKVITARTAKLYHILGKAAAAGKPSPGPPAAPRWPVQNRASTPGRSGSNGDSGTGGLSDAGALVVHLDRSIAIVPKTVQAPCPAYGPGRPLGGITPSGRERKKNEPFHETSTQAAWIAGVPTRGNVGPVRRPSGSIDIVQEESARRGLGGMRTPGGSVATGPGGGSVTAMAGVASLGGVSSTSSHRRIAHSPEGIRNGGSASGLAGGSVGLAGRNLSGAATRRGSSGGKAREQQMPQLSSQPPQRGPSRPPGAGPHPKASTAAAASATRRRGSAGGTDAYGSSVPASPRASGASELGASLESLQDLIHDSPALVLASMPGSPDQFLQTPRAAELPLVLNICRMWLDAGLSDKDWSDALSSFERELNNQPGVHKAHGPPGSGAGATEMRDGRWTLETFSMWVMRKGIKLKDCQLWFEAFDLDKDNMVGIADFLHGLTATSALRASEPASARGLCSALVLWRLLDVQKNPLDPTRLGGLLANARFQMPANDPASLQQMAQRASTDFDYVRATLLPLLSLPNFRIPRNEG